MILMVQVRVLAVASHTSSVPLVQARGADGSLIITSESSCNLPDGCHSLLDIPPGYMKYGWSSEPQGFTNPSPPTPRREVLMTPSARATAAKLALSGADSLSSEGVSGSQASVQTSGPSFAGTFQ